MASARIAIVSLLLLALVVSCAPAQKACTLEAMICPDGSSVGRSGPDCAFAACPAVQKCDASAPCPDGYGCYVFQDAGTICYTGDPCKECGGRCTLLESYPEQVVCGK